VSDDGRGISPTFLPYIFERFRQEDSSVTRESFGLGLGLSIAKHLVELHGGTIAASSRGPGHGATFVVELPGTVVEPGMSATVVAVTSEARPSRSLSAPA
jgi:signal transduction histidine kinase